MSYEARLGSILLPNFPYAGIAIALFVFAFGSKFAEFLVRVLLKSSRVRKLIAGNTHIEGYWLLRTDNPNGAESSLTQPAIACMQYDPSTNDMKVETIRYTHDGQKYLTISTMAHVRSNGLTIQYLNCFRLTYPGPEDRIGLSFGKFSHEGEGVPVSLEAHIAVAGEGASRRQIAERLDEDIVRKYKREHGREWTRQLLADSIKLNPSEKRPTIVSSA